MPLHKGAKPGSKKFGENVATEIRAGKDPKQAEAIAYSEARRDKNTRDGYGTVVATVGKYKIYEGKGRYDGFFVLAGGGEVDNFKTKAQALAEARKRTGDRLRVSKDAKGHVHVFLPKSTNYRGLARTLARGFNDQIGAKHLTPQQKADLAELEEKAKGDFMTPEARERLLRLRKLKKAYGDRKTKDMGQPDFAELKRLLNEFLSEEAEEPEHNKDCAGHKDCGCGCKH